MNITKKNSPNKYNGRSGWKPDMIVCHITEGSYAGAVSWLCNPKSQASAHFVVAKDGRITQLVDLRDGSWCNGTSTNPSSKVYYGESSLKAVRDRKTNANYYTVSIEHEGFWKGGKGKLTEAQKAATIELIKHIRSEVKSIFGVEIPADRAHIVGHYEVSPITKPNCPGQNFQFDEIISVVNGGAQEVKTPEVTKQSSGSFKVGDVATVKKTATKYATGQNIASFVKGGKYTIKELKKDRALLSGINSWVYLKDLEGQEGAAPTLKEGSKVKITGNTYATGQSIPGWVKNGAHTISEISRGKALLGANGGINSWVLTKDLKIIE
ncbi:MAG: peptidoglycan recognition protein family protein [Vallitaleaceae bacterium]|nr:peptidoglycan recognition protein family protein [Vallitaleaceae bacterium]